MVQHQVVVLCTRSLPDLHGNLCGSGLNRVRRNVFQMPVQTCMYSIRMFPKQGVVDSPHMSCRASHSSTFACRRQPPLSARDLLCYGLFRVDANYSAFAGHG